MTSLNWKVNQHTLMKGVMMSKAYDVIIIGGGSAGLSFARSLAYHGLNIAVVEKEALNALAEPDEDGLL
jgi:glycerol-3-phosphate dehydrogenase